MREANVSWEPIWRFGGRGPIWLTNLKLVKEIIGNYKLKPIEPEHFFGGTTFLPAEVREFGAKKLAAVRFPPFPCPGGIRFAHLHFKGDVYKLNDKQWSEFSTQVIKNFQDKLSKVKAISFEKVMEISEGIDNL